MFKRILGALVSALVVFAAGCGGGGGGSGGAGTQAVSMSVSQQSLAVAARTQGSSPSGALVVTVDHMPSTGLYLQGSYTTNGISSLTANPAGNVDQLSIAFRSPSSLGSGVYVDTITIQVCRDQQCTQQVANSPQQVRVVYTVTNGALPTLAVLSPSTVGRGGSEFVLTLTGANFDSGSRVYWNGSLKSSMYVSDTQIAVTIPASDIAVTGNYPVSVATSLDPGLPSNPLLVSVANAALSLATLSPTSVTVGNSAFTQTVLGTGFDSSSVVKWNGSARPTTYVSTTELLAQISATDVASPTTASVTVAGTNSSLSNAKMVTVAPPSVDATNVQTNALHSGAINFANIVAPSAFPLSSKWVAPMIGTTFNVLTGAGRVYAMAYTLYGGGIQLSALSADTGAVLWGPISLGARAFASYDNGRVFVLTTADGGAGTLLAYDAASGVQLWSSALSSEPYFYGSAPTVANGMIYVTGYGSAGTLFAVDQANGSLAWKKPISGGQGGAPTATADSVYVSSACSIYAFRPLTGELIWSNDTGCSGSVPGYTPVIANGIVYSYGNLSSYDARTGTPNSTFAGFGALPVVGQQTGYFLWSNNLLQAIHLSDGTTQWSATADGYLMSSSPLLVNNYLFAYSAADNFYAWDATTGNLLWQVDASHGRTASVPRVTGTSKVYAGAGMLFLSRDNTLVAYTLSTNP